MGGCLRLPFGKNWGRALVGAKSCELSKLVHDATTMHVRCYSNKIHLKVIPLSFIDLLVSIFLISATAVPRDGFPCVRSASGSTTQPAKCLHNAANIGYIHCTVAQNGSMSMSMSIAAMGML